MLNFVKSLRPMSIDAWAGCKTSPAAQAWKIFRASTVDRALLWGLTIAFVLPFLFSLVGGGFAFVATVPNFAVVAATFWVLSFASAFVIGGALKKLLPEKLVRPAQEVNLLVSFGVLLWLLSGWFSLALQVSTAGIAVGALVLWAFTAWSFGGWQKVCDGKCANCACKQKQQEPEDCGCGK